MCIRDLSEGQFMKKLFFKAVFLLWEHKTKQAANGQVSANHTKGRLACPFQLFRFQG